MALLSTGFSYLLLIFLLLLIVPDPRPKMLLGHLVESIIIYVDDYVEDRDRVDRLAELLRGPSLTSAQIAEIEKQIGYNTVPLSLQKDFIERALAERGPYDALLRGASHEDLWRAFSTIDVISSRFSKAYRSKARYPQSQEYWDRVERYETAHQYWTFGEGECNGTVIVEGQHFYRLTAHHCVVSAVDGDRWAVDVARDLAVQYVPVAELSKWNIGSERELPRIARDIAAARIGGRLIFSNGHGRDFSYYRKVVRKVHFSFAIDSGLSPDSYWMILPLAESARWLNPSGGFGGVGAKGSSGSAIVDAATGQIVGVLSAVTRACLVSGRFVFVNPGSEAESVCNFVGVGSSALVGIWSSAQRALPLLRESRVRAGFQ